MGPDAHLAELSRTIQLAVAPVFLLTALVTLLGVLSVRLGRIVDRSRALAERAPADGIGGLGRTELENLHRRRHFVNRAITSATLAALLMSLLIAVAFLGFLFHVDFAYAMATLFIASMAGLVVALLFFLREVLLAVATSPRSPHEPRGD